MQIRVQHTRFLVRSLTWLQMQQVYAWMDSQSNVTYLNVDYNQMLENPMIQVPQINAFLGGDLDEQSMIAEVDPTLYRQRK